MIPKLIGVPSSMISATIYTVMCKLLWAYYSTSHDKKLTQWYDYKRKEKNREKKGYCMEWKAVCADNALL